jgi:hypothetical protein
MPVYKVFLNTNHIHNANRVGFFNPAMMLRFNQGESDFEKNVIALHERVHAHLSASLYGRILFLLRFLITDMMAHWAFCDSRTDFDTYWDCYSKVNNIITTLVSRWIITHEGLAVYSDFLYLSKRADDESGDMLHTLQSVVADTANPYGAGYYKVNILARRFKSYQHLSGFLHELANIEYFPIEELSIESIQTRIAHTHPDAILEEILKDPEFGKRAFFSHLPEQGYIPYLRQELIKSGYPIFQDLTSQITLGKILGSKRLLGIFPKTYRNRISQLRPIHESSGKFKKDFISTRLMFDAYYDPEGRVVVVNDPPPNPQQPELIGELQILCGIDWAISHFLPHDNNGFRQYLQQENLGFVNEHDFALLYNAFQ